MARTKSPDSKASKAYAANLGLEVKLWLAADKLRNNMNAAVYEHVALDMPMFVVPPAKLVQKFNAIAEAAHLPDEDNKQQSRTLATLRDTLLPKLLSGELSGGQSATLD